MIPSAVIRTAIAGFEKLSAAQGSSNLVTAARRKPQTSCSNCHGHHFALGNFTLAMIASDDS
jgi:cytochrome c553